MKKMQVQRPLILILPFNLWSLSWHFLISSVQRFKGSFSVNLIQLLMFSQDPKSLPYAQQLQHSTPACAHQQRRTLSVFGQVFSFLPIKLSTMVFGKEDDVTTHEQGFNRDNRAWTGSFLPRPIGRELLILFFLWNNDFKKLKTMLFSEVSWNNAGLMFRLHNWWDLWDSYLLGSILLLQTVRADWQTSVTLWLLTSSWNSVSLQASAEKECRPPFVWYMCT